MPIRKKSSTPESVADPEPKETNEAEGRLESGTTVGASEAPHEPDGPLLVPHERASRRRLVAGSVIGVTAATASIALLLNLAATRDGDQPAEAGIEVDADESDAAEEAASPGTARNPAPSSSSTAPGADLPPALLRLEGHEGPGLHVIALDDRQLASGGMDGTVRLWDLDKPKDPGAPWKP